MTHDALAMVDYESRPVLLVVADSEMAAARARSAAEQAGCRVADTIDIAGASDRLDRQVAADTILVELDRDHGAELDCILDRLEWAARGSGQGSVISAPMELVDAVASRAWHASILHLVNAGQDERAAALTSAARRAEPQFHDHKSQPGRLQQLSEEVGRIANILATLSSEDEPLASVQDEEDDPAVTAASIRAIIKARRLRDRYFASALFADPAFDMLLDLMAARLDRERVAVSSLCIAAAVPATTALRWIKALTDQGLFVRTADPHDGRRVFIELSDRAAAQLAAYLKAVQRIAPALI